MEMNSLFFSRRSVACLLLACLSVAVLTVAPAGFAKETIARKKVKLDRKPAIVDPSSPKLPLGLRATNARVGIMVELADAPAIQSWTSARVTRGLGGARVAAKTQIERIKSAQASLVPLLTQRGVKAKILYQVGKAYNGIAIMVKPSKIAAIEALPGVKAVHRLVPKYRTGTNEGTTDLPFLGVPTVWASSIPGIHGEGVKVAVIDTGIDYLHADFGGPGAPEPAVDANATAPALYFPNAKIVGGYDFAGDDYDAAGAAGSTTPTPDSNPLDNTASGHGTAVASVIGGYGLKADGTTYTGAYDGSTDFSTFLLSPGAAPACQFYAVKVFGKPEGSTNLVAQAVDYALDPNNKGDFSDHVDVINLSLGSSDGYPDDPDAVACSNAAAAGIIVCVSAGNGEGNGAGPNQGQHYYIVGSPSVANGVLSVAASFNDQAGLVYDSAVTVSAPPGIAGTYGSLYGSTSPVLTSGLSGKAVYADPANGSTALNNAAAVSGNICVIDRGTVSFTTKINNAIAAGAIGVVIVNNKPGGPIAMSTTGTTASIPAVMISQADGQTIEGSLTTGSDSPVNATIGTQSSYTATGSSPATDTVTSYTSRGPRHEDSFLKPDLTAPGDFVLEAKNISGNGIRNYDGTSFSCPHVAGEMALLKQLHPTWTVEELMALAMDTATHDISGGATTGAAPLSGLGRIGVGRIDEAQAAAAPAVAYNADDSMLISASFGVVDVVTSTNLTKNIKISNKSGSSVTYDLSVDDVTTVPGVTYGFIGGSTTSVTIPGNSSTTVPVVLSADPTQMRHTRNAADSATSTGTFPDGSNVPGLARYWISEAASYLVLTPTNGTPGPAMRLSLYAVPRPASATSLTAGQSLTFPTPTGTFSFTLSGTGVHNTLPNSDPNSDPTMDVISLVKPFELQYSSEDLGAPIYDKPSDLKYVGISSDYLKTPTLQGVSAPTLAYTTITFGIDTYGNASTPGPTDADREIDIDSVTTDGNGNVIANVPDGTPDYALFVSDVGGNVYLTELYQFATGVLIAENYVNSTPSGSFDTNAMNNSSISLPVAAGDIGLVDGNPSRFNYQYFTFDPYGSLIDTTPTLTYDPIAPGLDPDLPFTEPIFYTDDDQATVSGNYDAAAFRANRSLGLLLIHTHAQSGQHSEILLQGSRPKITSFTPSGSVGNTVTFTGKNFDGATAVQFFGADAVTFAVVSSTEITAVVPSGALSGTVRIVTPGGVATTRTKFVVSPGLP
jgi:subtilisin family serine protease